jgi:hypothetical protein
MKIVFNEEHHAYICHDPEKPQPEIWTSATTFIKKFKPEFDGKSVAAKVSKNKKSKWYGIAPEQIEAIWKDEAERATTLGSWYHKQQETNILSCETIDFDGHELKVHPPLYDEFGEKIAPNQKLQDGIYPEHLIYLPSMKLAGQSDLVYVADGKINIIDYKSNKEIKTKGFTSWEGITARMNMPIGHLDDCNYIHYNLQLSLYMYMMLKHNPKLEAGALKIHHVKFVEDPAGYNKYGFPVYKTTEQGDYIVQGVEVYEMPYLKDEIHSMCNWHKATTSGYD